MNLITCDQHCRHQQDGYCALNHISNLTSDISSACGYYESVSDTKTPSKPENPQGFTSFSGR